MTRLNAKNFVTDEEFDYLEPVQVRDYYGLELLACVWKLLTNKSLYS